MSMHAPVGYQIPDKTLRGAMAAFPKGNLYMERSAELGMRYTNQQFTHLFFATAPPAHDPVRGALVHVFPLREGLSDRQAAEAVHRRIDWTCALGLELTDPDFDASVLREFRQRLIAGNTEDLLLHTLLIQLQERGFLKARTKPRTDSTHVLAAMRTLNRLELIIEMVRFALNFMDPMPRHVGVQLRRNHLRRC